MVIDAIVVQAFSESGAGEAASLTVEFDINSQQLWRFMFLGVDAHTDRNPYVTQ
jgi:hypothetical protein